MAERGFPGALETRDQDFFAAVPMHEHLDDMREHGGIGKLEFAADPVGILVFGADDAAPIIYGLEAGTVLRHGKDVLDSCQVAMLSIVFAQ